MEYFYIGISFLLFLIILAYLLRLDLRILNRLDALSQYTQKYLINSNSKARPKFDVYYCAYNKKHGKKNTVLNWILGY